MKAVILTVAFMLLSHAMASARIYATASPDDMAGPSTLICNGVVESITDAGTGKNVDHSEMGMFTAKIKVLHILKGKAGDELEFQYKNNEWLIPNGANQIQLEKGKRYRFFLKNGATPSYFVGVLEGAVDDGSAVEPLLPNEPDDCAYVTKDEVMQIVQKWMAENYPNIPYAADHATWQKLHAESHQPYWVINTSNRSDGSWSVSIVKVSPQGSELEDKTMEISRNRTVTIENR